MSYREHGFLSPNLETWRERIRAEPEHKKWFGFADCLNQFGMAIYERLPDSFIREQFVVALLFARAHQSFQAAIILVERGLIGDARTITRSAVESAIALGAISKDAAFVDKLVDAALAHKVKVANVLLGDPNLRTECSQEQITQFQHVIAEAQALGRPLKTIIWEQVAQDRFKDLYNLLYRHLSGDGAHVSIDALDRHVSSHENKIIKGLKLGPTTDGLLDALETACTAFLWALTPTVRFFGMNDFEDRLGDEIKKYSALYEVNGV